MSPTVSVVVPFRDVAEHLRDCLESLARQTLRDLEVIMVDDGSADGGADLARRYADRDARFVLLQGDGAGPGPARNLGIERARGRYLAFADGDDALPPHAYELLTGSLEATGSDLAGGNVQRLDGGRVWQSWLHAEPYATAAQATHITQRTVLLQDRTVWNKVYRRSFWDANRLEFPAMLYEDPPVSIEAHVLAFAVDVLDATVYYWRHRPGSITQNRHDMGNVTDRMASLRMVRAVLGDHAPELLPAYDRYALDLDVRALVHALPRVSERERALLVELGAEIVAAAAPSAADGLASVQRLELHLLRERMLPELLEVLRFEEGGLHDVPLVSRGKLRQRWYARYPFFGDAQRAVPDEVYDVTDEFRLWTLVDRAQWDDGVLVVEGRAHFDRLPVTSANDSRIRLWLRDTRTGREVKLPVERVNRPDATAVSGQSAVSYDWSGFRARIDLDSLRDGGEWRTGTWELHAEVATAGRKAAQRLTSAVPAVHWAAARQVDEHVMAQPAATDGFVLHIKRIKAVITGYRRAGDTVELTGWTRRALGAGAALVAARRDGGAEVRGEITLRPAATLRTETGTGFDFTAVLPLAALLPATASCGAHLRDAAEWDIRLTGTGGPVRLTVTGAFPGARFAYGDREFALTRTAYGNLRGIERTRRPVVTSAAWDPSGRLILSGTLAGPATSADAQPDAAPLAQPGAAPPAAPSLARPTPPSATGPAQPGAEPTRPDAVRPAHPGAARPTRPGVTGPAPSEAARPARLDAARPTQPGTTGPARLDAARPTHPGAAGPSGLSAAQSAQFGAQPSFATGAPGERPLTHPQRKPDDDDSDHATANTYTPPPTGPVGAPPAHNPGGTAFGGPGEQFFRGPAGNPGHRQSSEVTAYTAQLPAASSRPGWAPHGNATLGGIGERLQPGAAAGPRHARDPERARSGEVAADARTQPLARPIGRPARGRDGGVTSDTGEKHPMSAGGQHGRDRNTGVAADALKPTLAMAPGEPGLGRSGEAAGAGGQRVPGDSAGASGLDRYGRDVAAAIGQSPAILGETSGRHDDGGVAADGGRRLPAEPAGEAGREGDAGRPDHLLLRRRGSSDVYRVPVTWDGEGFNAVIAPETMSSFGVSVPLSSGTWEVLTPDGDAVVMERTAICRLPGWHAVETHEVEVDVHQVDALLLRSRVTLADDERGHYAQRLLRDRDYPVYLRSPLTEMVVFDSYGASQYSCNPRAIYEELVRRRSGLECVWVSKDGQIAPEGDARTVLAGSREHYRTLARARYVVTNYGLPPWFIKRPDQRYLQTWHGTPIKRIAHDLREMPFQRVEDLDWLDHEVTRWDLLLSPNPFTTEVMRKACRYDGEILECGYPRNDVLSSTDFARAAARVRARLGVPKDKRLVLYAPTWRDDLQTSPGRRGFSLELDVGTLRRALGDDHLLLIRTHHLVNDRPHYPADDFVIDVSRYPDIADLYLVADVLVTDYSSAMVDFACTGRPMIFYAYDLERYRDHVRGFTLDLEVEAPGPLVTSSAEVAEALRAVDEIQNDYVDNYDRFFDKYCPHDDGRAAARVIDRFFC